MSARLGRKIRELEDIRDHAKDDDFIRDRGRAISVMLTSQRVRTKGLCSAVSEFSHDPRDDRNHSKLLDAADKMVIGGLI